MPSIDWIDVGRRNAEIIVIVKDAVRVTRQADEARERAAQRTSRRAQKYLREAAACDLEAAALNEALVAACTLEIKAKEEEAKAAAGKQFELLVNALKPGDPAIGWLVTHNGVPLAYACYTKAEVDMQRVSPGHPRYNPNEKWYYWTSPIGGVMTLAQHVGDPAYDVHEDSHWTDAGALSSFGSASGILSHFRDKAKARPGWGAYLIDPLQWAAAVHCGDTPPDFNSHCYGDMSVFLQELQDEILRKRVRPGRMMAALVAHHLGKSKWGEELEQPLVNYFRECPADYFLKPAKEPPLVIEWKLEDHQVATWHTPQCGGWEPESAW